jgi:hypothetical protein
MAIWNKDEAAKGKDRGSSVFFKKVSVHQNYQ